MQKYYHLVLTVATFSNSSLLEPATPEQKKGIIFIMWWPYWKTVVLVFGQKCNKLKVKHLLQVRERM